MNGTEGLTHLHTHAREALALSKQERVQRAHELPWINYPAAEKLHLDLETLVTLPSSHRPPCRALLAAPNNGKTRLLRRFAKKHAPAEDPSIDEGPLEVPVIMIEALDGPHERQFFNQVIDAFGVPFRPDDNIHRLRYKAERLLTYFKTRVLLIDEFHVIASGTPAMQRNLLNILKNLSSRRRMSIVVSGVQEATAALAIDTQFSSRFRTVHLPLWEGSAWRRLAHSLEGHLPFPEPSHLGEARFAERLLFEAESTIG
ncbi:MAG: TniB family NTP-binding protein, partial [Algiphilus sp.]